MTLQLARHTYSKVIKELINILKIESLIRDSFILIKEVEEAFKGLKTIFTIVLIL
jgi:hypothetical protein